MAAVCDNTCVEAQGRHKALFACLVVQVLAGVPLRELYRSTARLEGGLDCSIVAPKRKVRALGGMAWEASWSPRQALNPCLRCMLVPAVRCILIPLPQLATGYGSHFQQPHWWRTFVCAHCACGRAVHRPQPAGGQPAASRLRPQCAVGACSRQPAQARRWSHRWGEEVVRPLSTQPLVQPSKNKQDARSRPGLHGSHRPHTSCSAEHVDAAVPQLGQQRTHGELDCAAT